MCTDVNLGLLVLKIFSFLCCVVCVLICSEEKSHMSVTNNKWVKEVLAFLGQGASESSLSE